MNLLTCFKVVPDLDRMIDEDWDSDGLQVETRYVRKVLNYHDESALELSLRLLDEAAARGRQVDLTAMSVGGPEVDQFLRNLYALRVHRAVRVEAAGDLRFAPRSLAGIFSDYIEKNNIDVLLMGKQSAEGGNALTSFFTAELLGWPCISDVTALRFGGGGTLVCASRLDGGMQEQVVRLPCVFVVGDAQNTALRIPTLKDKMRYGKRDIEVLEAGDVSGSEGFTLRALRRADHSRAGTVIPGSTPVEKARILYEQYLNERMGRL